MRRPAEVAADVNAILAGCPRRTRSARWRYSRRRVSSVVAIPFSVTMMGMPATCGGVADRPADRLRVELLAHLVLLCVVAGRDDAVRPDDHARIGLHAHEIVAAQLSRDSRRSTPAETPPPGSRRPPPPGCPSARGSARPGSSRHRHLIASTARRCAARMTLARAALVTNWNSPSRSGGTPKACAAAPTRALPAGRTAASSANTTARFGSLIVQADADQVAQVLAVTRSQ